MNLANSNQDHPQLDKIFDAEPIPLAQRVGGLPKTNLFELMLSPKSLQVMMSVGGGVLAIGCAVWLWSLGVFDNPLVAALALAGVNLGVLCLGVWLVANSRFGLAGRGLAFLSSLLMPLHLWFYDAQGLMVLNEGGHLWFPALIICGLYALVARLTRDSIFVYTLMGGVLLTGLLFLAGPQMAFLWPVLPTCLFLVLLGTVAIHADHLFVEPSGAFSRNEFGRAFFRAGHLTVAAGLGYLLSAQLSSFLYGRVGGFIVDPDLFNPVVSWWSVLVLGVAFWAYQFSHISRPRGNFYMIAAGGVFLWGLLTTLQIFAIAVTPNLILMLMALGVVGLQIFERPFAAARSTVAGTGEIDSLHGSPSELNQQNELVFSLANMMLAAAAIGQATLGLFSGELWLVSGLFLAQVLLTAISIGMQGLWSVGEENRALFNLRSGTVGLLLALMGVLGLGSCFVTSGLTSLALVAGVVACLAVLSHLLNHVRFQLMSVGVISGGVVGVAMAFAALLIHGELLFGSLAALGVVLAAGGGMLHVAVVTGRQEAWVVCSLFFVTLFAQIVMFLEITSAYTVIMSLSLLGVAMLSIAWGFAGVGKVVGQEDSYGEKSAELPWGIVAGNLLVVCGTVAAMLFVLSQILMSHSEIKDIGLLLFQAIPLGIGFLLNKIKSWRHTFVSLMVTSVMLAAGTLITTSNVPMVHRIEVTVMILGLIALITGHIGWYREQLRLENGGENLTSNHRLSADRMPRDEAVSASLIFGAVMLAIPVMLGMVAFRVFGYEFSSFWVWFHEIGSLAIGLLMLGCGVLCKIRSTTITGFSLLSVYVTSLLVLVRLPEQLQSISILMMVGGGLFFGIGILLSVYRDWFLAIPHKVKQGEGVFRVLKWR